MKTRLILLIFLLSLNTFGITPTKVRTIDKPLYTTYLEYCNSRVIDTVYMVGYKTIPLTLKGGYLTQSSYLNSSKYNNQLRKRTYKNVPKTVSTLPTLSSTKALCWFPISYYTLQRKSSIRDFYEWYYIKILKMPKFWK